MADIYFSREYGLVHASVEGGAIETFVHRGAYGEIRHMFVRREIRGHRGVRLWDITTPYGYGGPVITHSEPGGKAGLIDSFFREFSEYCRDTNVVAEFVRFHPLVGNASDFASIYSLDGGRRTVVTALQGVDDPTTETFTKSCRKSIRRAYNAGVSATVVERPSSLEEFEDVYYSTMERNRASDFYYFGKEYFDDFVQRLGDNIVVVRACLDQQVIAMSLCMVSDEFIHVHLSGTLSAYLPLSPAYVLRHALTQWGKKQGMRLIHHGGGRSSAPEDPLYRFKKQFGEDAPNAFHVGQRVWDMDRYLRICRAAGVSHTAEGFFPAYRRR